MPVCTCNMYYHTYICRLSTVGTGRYMHKYVHKYTRILGLPVLYIYVCLLVVWLHLLALQMTIYHGPCAAAIRPQDPRRQYLVA